MKKHNNNPPLDNDLELLPVVDSDGNVICSATRAECHRPGGPLHPVVHLHVFDPQGNLFLQLRPLWKKIQPGRWDTSVGGHVSYGEDILPALKRETFEELGIRDFTPEFVAKYVFHSPVENELVYVFRTLLLTQPSPGDELAGGRFWTHEEILSAKGKGILTPNFESEYNLIECGKSPEAAGHIIP